jgi:hypothetical protein
LLILFNFFDLFAYKAPEALMEQLPELKRRDATRNRCDGEVENQALRNSVS